MAELVRRVGEEFADRLQQVVLYGSRARGDAHHESDIDVLVVLRDEPSAADRRLASTLASDVETSTNAWVLLSVVVMSRARLEALRARERLFALDVDREGIVL